MAKGQADRVRRPLNRRATRPQIRIHVTEPGVIVIDQGKRADHIDAPPGTVIERPISCDEQIPPEDQEI